MAKITALEIYLAYPRKVARIAALAAITRALGSTEHPIDPVTLLERVEHYARHCKSKEKQYVPHPATWFNRGSYFDVDDDPDAWPIGPEIPVGEAWEMIVEAIRTIGRHGPGATRSPGDVLPSFVYDAVKQVGWNKLCDMTDRSRKDTKEQFRIAYERSGGQVHGRIRETIDRSRREGQDGTGQRQHDG